MSIETARRLTAILAADVVNYSRLMGDDQAGTLDALRQLRTELFEPIVEKYRGSVVKRMGDGWIVEFPSVSDAVSCAIDVQTGLENHELIRLRMGIHIGEVVFEQEDVFGDGVNVAARLEALASPSQVLISDTAYNSLDHKTGKLFSGGETHQLKNISRPITVWAWSVSGLEMETSVNQDVVAVPDNPSIAVLAFDNMSGDPDQEYFANGIAEDIITALSRFNQYHVIARNSSFTYKGQSVAISQVGRELGVRYVLEGSVRKADNRIRVTAQLIEAHSGKHIWADRYDGLLEDVFDMQDGITDAIAAALSPAMTNAELDRISHVRPENFASWDFTLKSLDYFNTADPEGINLSRQFAEKAISLDPRNIIALCQLATCHITGGWMGYSDNPKATIEKGIKAARQALQIDNSDAFALSMLGYGLFAARQFDEGLDYLHQGTQRNKNFAGGWLVYGMGLGFSGLCDRGLEAIDLAIRLSPRDPWLGTWIAQKAVTAFIAKRYELSLQFGQKAVRETPEFPGGHRVSAASLAELGRIEEARQEVANLLVLFPNITVALTRATMPFRYDEARERYCAALAKAGLPLE